jgi:hypothetical protein
MTEDIQKVITVALNNFEGTDLRKCFESLRTKTTCMGVYPDEVRIEVLTAVIMKNAVFRYVSTQFVPHKKHITSPLQSPVSSCYIRREVSMVVTMKITVFWDITPCGSCKNRQF